jgi:hypothetical protein
MVRASQFQVRMSYSVTDMPLDLKVLTDRVGGLVDVRLGHEQTMGSITFAGMIHRKPG